jgi:hypothetical protein
MRDEGGGMGHTGMTAVGWVFMVLAWGIIGGLSVWCVKKVVWPTSPPK